MRTKVCPSYIYPFAIVILAMFLAGGCSRDHYKQDADREVDSIIKSKWAEQFGPIANSRISDVQPDPNDLSGQIELPPSKMLKLADAVAIATAANRDYQSQKENLYLQALDLTLARNQFAPQLFGIFGSDYDFDGSGAGDTLGFDSSAGFNMLLADGARVGVSVAHDWLRYLTGDPATSMASVLTATITQPLLAGRGRKVVLENLTQAERDTVYQMRTFGRYRKTFVVSIVNDYFRVLQAQDSVANAYNNLSNLQFSQDYIENHAEAGRIPKIQVGQAQQRTLEARDRYVQAQQNYEQTLDRFKITLALPTDIKITLDPNELKALEMLSIAEPNFTEEEAFDVGLSQRLDLASSADRVEDARRKVDVAADGLGARLDLVGTAAIDTDDQSNFSQLKYRDDRYSIGFDAELPLERTSERNAYRRSLITYTRRERDYALALDNVKLDIRQAFRDLREASARYKIQVQSLELAKSRVENTTLQLKAGRVDTRDVLDAQSDLLTAQNSRTAALIDHTLATLRFYRDVGILQVKPDGLWEKLQ